MASIERAGVRNKNSSGVEERRMDRWRGPKEASLPGDCCYSSLGPCVSFCSWPLAPSPLREYNSGLQINF